MSKDIRSFFKVKSKPLFSNDNEIIPESPEVQITKKKQESRKRRILDDSSDEEISKHSKSNDNKKNSNSQRKKKNSPKEIKKPMKQIEASEIFGTTPVKRTEPIVKKNKKHAKTETGIHSDDEFERSLLELDNAETGTDINNIKNSICVPESDGKSTSNGGTCVPFPKGSSVKSENTSDSNKLNVSNSSETINKDERSNAEKNEKKRDFSVFIDDTESIDTQQTKDYNNHDMQNKRRKMDKSLNESAVLDEERFEKKRMSAILYKNYLNRSGPKHLGSKVIPEGTPTCLKDCAIVLTGVLDSFERDEIAAAIIKYGGAVKNSVSKKVTHVLVGEDAGPAKINKAKELGIKIINEDEFLELIKECSKALPENNDNKPETKTEKTKTGVNSERNKKKDKMDSVKFTKTTNKVSPDKTNNFEKPVNKKKHVDKPVTNEKPTNSEKIPEKDSSYSSLGSNNENLRVPPLTFDRPTDLQHLMWVDKYKPQTVKQIIGQHGDASNAKKLSNWLMRWYINRKEKIPKPSPWSKNDDGAYYKAALLSGPPGVGKTTTVMLVCKELGFDTVEFNASDTRNKTLIREQISELLTTTSLSGYAKGNIGKKAITKKHVLVMDEVDGMAGNEDRGGLQELISLIKITAVPIICMCNDRNSQKMRSLVNYCYDLKFSRPRVDQIKSAMMSVCFKEGIKIHPDALTQLILAANQDVRQTLNMLSMWSVNKKHLENDQIQKDVDSVKKDIKLGPWEAVRKVFTEDEQKKMSLNDKSDLFFYDYSLAPLFVQENYLHVMPHCPKNEIPKRVSMAADSISMGDLIENRIRSKGSWNLLPMQAMYSSVIPGHVMSGHVAGQIQFPSWLGKNSRANKLARLVQEIHAHTRLSTSGSKSSIFLDYAKHLRDAIVTPLVTDRLDGIANSLEVLQSYHLLRDDLDSLNELAMWPGQRDPMILVDSKVKAAMTRSYNKEASALPYAPGNVKRSRGKVDTENGDLVEDNIEQEDENFSDSDPENDMLIKKKKKPSAKDKETEGSKSIKSEKGKGKKSKTKS